jgi:hypothetical protein
MRRREALKWTGAALATVFATQAVAEDDAPPKGPKIGPPPQGLDSHGKPEDDAKDALCTSNMTGLVLRVVKPGQVVTQEYNEGRLTITVDKNNRITDIRIG